MQSTPCPNHVLYIPPTSPLYVPKYLLSVGLEKFPKLAKGTWVHIYETQEVGSGERGFDTVNNYPY